MTFRLHWKLYRRIYQTKLVWIKNTPRKYEGNSVFKLSKMADYSLVLLSHVEEDTLMPVSQLVERTKLPEPTVYKVMRLLVKADIVSSIRGPQGGYKLSTKSEDISADAIITAIDGSGAITACTEEGAEECVLLQGSPAAIRLHKINGAVKLALQNITLKDLAV